MYMNIALFKHKSIISFPSHTIPRQTVTQQHHKKDVILTLKHCHGFYFDNLCT